MLHVCMFSRSGAKNITFAQMDTIEALHGAAKQSPQERAF